jgi:SAM-dependent methyltransferase
MTFGLPLSADEVALFETFVVPRYLSFFGSMAVEMLLAHAPAHIAHLGCRTGYPDGLLADKLPGCVLVGVDPSGPALELARTKASLLSGVDARYELADARASRLGSEAFTHALALHPVGGAEQRAPLLAEMRRLLVSGGQALVALPLRGSFPEVGDLVREHARRQDDGALAVAMDAAAQRRPTLETLSEELEDAGFADVDVDVQLIAVSFATGRDFLEHPVARLVVLPEVRALLRVDAAAADAAFRHVGDAIAKYWSDGVFELTVNVGCASGRRL